MAELNVFFSGASIIKFSAASYDDIVKCIFDVEKYKIQDFWLRLWFIFLFVFFVFAYFNLFLNLLHETPKYRSIKLYRYGKDRYLGLCIKKALYADLCVSLVMAAGVLLSGLILTLQGNEINISRGQFIEIALQFIKLFLVMSLYGSVTVYLMLKRDSNFAMYCMLCFIFVQLAVEVFTYKWNFITYADIYKNAGYIIFLIIFNIAVNYLIRRSVKKISMC